MIRICFYPVINLNKHTSNPIKKSHKRHTKNMIRNNVTLVNMRTSVLIKLNNICILKKLNNSKNTALCCYFQNDKPKGN